MKIELKRDWVDKSGKTWKKGWKITVLNEIARPLIDNGTAVSVEKVYLPKRRSRQKLTKK